MGAKAGYLTTVKRGGTSTAFTNEAMSLVSGKTYQITDVTKRVWDRTVTPTVKDNGVTVAASNIAAIDYLFGKVTFAAGYSVTGPVTLSGNYRPMQVIAGAYEYQLNQSATVLDRTDYETAQANGGFRTRLLGLHDVSVSVSRWDDHSKAFTTLKEQRTPVLVEIRPGGSGDIFRGWFVIETTSPGGDLDGLTTEELSFQLDGDGAGKAFSWGT